MSTVGLKLASLAIRTLSKPIASRLKTQAREHPRFRRVCINIAQAVHRTDMTLRLNLLRDSSVLEKEELAEKKALAEKRARETAAKEKEAKEASTIPTPPGTPTAESELVPTAPASPTLPKVPSPEKDAPVHADKAASVHTASETVPTPTKLRIRPLSESKAVDRGASFISEFFLFAVAGGLILFESIRSRRKEASRRDLVADRLEALEKRDKEKEERIIELERELWIIGGQKGEPKHKEWTVYVPKKKTSWFGSFFTSKEAEEETKEENKGKAPAVTEAKAGEASKTTKDVAVATAATQASTSAA